MKVAADPAAFLAFYIFPAAFLASVFCIVPAVGLGHKPNLKYFLMAKKSAVKLRAMCALNQAGAFSAALLCVPSTSTGAGSDLLRVFFCKPLGLCQAVWAAYAP